MGKRGGMGLGSWHVLKEGSGGTGPGDVPDPDDEIPPLNLSAFPLINLNENPI